MNAQVGRALSSFHNPVNKIAAAEQLSKNRNESAESQAVTRGQETGKTEELKDENVIKMPWTPKDKIQLPAELLKMGLFRAGRIKRAVDRKDKALIEDLIKVGRIKPASLSAKGDKIKLEDEMLIDAVIVNVAGLNVTYTGAQLSVEHDQRLLAALIDLAQNQKLGSKISVTHAELCEKIGWPKNGTYKKIISDTLKRLKNGTLYIRQRMLSANTEDGVSLIGDYRKSSTGKKIDRTTYAFHFSELFLSFFDRKSFVWLDEKGYFKLSPSQRVIFGYASCHKKPNDLKLKTVQALMGTEVPIAQFKQRLMRDLKALKNEGLINNGGIRKELMWIENKKLDIENTELDIENTELDIENTELDIENTDL